MPSYDEAQAIAGDTSAQRLLNLFFIFNASTRALSTEEIVSDSDLGYGSPQRDSDLRKFRRDRAKLAEQGIQIVEAKPLGAAESEESYWKLDRENTFATGGIVPGTSYYGDRVPIMANSGELILNKVQQGNLFRMLNEGGAYGRGSEIRVTGELVGRGSNLVAVIRNQEKTNARTR